MDFFFFNVFTSVIFVLFYRTSDVGGEMSFGGMQSWVKLPKVSWLKFSLHSSNTTAVAKAAQCASRALRIKVVMC